jgi:hypothetical protein
MDRQGHIAFAHSIANIANQYGEGLLDNSLHGSQCTIRSGCFSTATRKRLPELNHVRHIIRDALCSRLRVRTFLGA